MSRRSRTSSSGPVSRWLLSLGASVRVGAPQGPGLWGRPALAPPETSPFSWLWFCYRGCVGGPPVDGEAPAAKGAPEGAALYQIQDDYGYVTPQDAAEAAAAALALLPAGWRGAACYVGSPAFGWWGVWVMPVVSAPRPSCAGAPARGARGRRAGR